MIDRVSGNKTLPDNIRKDIIERTDGIPLFAEEMTKAVLEAEDEGEPQQIVAAVPSPALAVPPSLYASLMARLDRLGPALYDPVEHRPLATRFGQDVGVVILTFRSWAMWCLSYPTSARIDLERGIRHAREIGQAGTLMFALTAASPTNLFIGDYAAEFALLDELAGLAQEKSAMLCGSWKNAPEVAYWH